MRVVAALVVIPLLLAASLAESEQQWRANYEKDLRAPDGWLAVSGLFWLHQGPNTAGSDSHSFVKLPADAPAHAGVFRLEHGQVTWVTGHGQRTAMEPDTSDHPTVVRIGDLALTVIKRSDRIGIRLRDPKAVTRREFAGTRWFAPDPSWVIKAKWIALPQPKKLVIVNILGMADSEECPGYAEWTRSGGTMRLDPVVEDNQLFFMFKDATNGKTTYPAGRFLYSDMPKKGEVTLDFNHAHNPPCAFTAYATCPLPPKQNWLPVAVDAGEKMYGHHGA